MVYFQLSQARESMKTPSICCMHFYYFFSGGAAFCMFLPSLPVSPWWNCLFPKQNIMASQKWWRLFHVTIGKTNILSRCISYWTWGFSNVMLVFRGVFPILGFKRRCMSFTSNETLAWATPRAVAAAQNDDTTASASTLRRAHQM